jgi:hypothetical protein
MSRFSDPVELANSDEAWGIEHRVVDHDAGSPVWAARPEVVLLCVDVPPHAGVPRIGSRAVARRHPTGGHLERNVQKCREVRTALTLWKSSTEICTTCRPMT